MSFDPYAPGFDADPHPTLRTLRESHPVYYWEAGRAYLVSRYDECLELLRDPRFGFMLEHWKHASEIPRTPLDDYFTGGLFNMDGADHLRVRKLMGPAFSPRGMERWRGVIEGIVAELLDDLAGEPSFDLVSRFSSQIPVRVISQILGVPRAHDAQFRTYATTVVRGVDPLQRRLLTQEQIDVLYAGRDLVHALIEERRSMLGDDMMSDLIRTEEAGDRLQTEELLMLVKSLLVAGSETTMHLLNFGALALMRHPDQLALARSRPEQMANAVDEVLRFDFMSRLGNPRFSLEPIEIAGSKIDAGEMVMPLMTSALRDPRRFSDPDRFDVTRDQRYNAAFGNGPHYCVGAGLARLEGQVALGALFERYPRLRLQAEPVYAFHPMLRNAASIQVAAE